MSRRSGTERPIIRIDRQLFDRTPPHSPEMERATAGAVMLDPKALTEAREILEDGGAFYDERLATIYRAACATQDHHGTVNVVLVHEHLRDSGTIDEVGGRAELLKLAQETPGGAGVPHYARIIADKAKLRRLIEAAGEAVYAAYHLGDAESVDEVIAQAVVRLKRIDRGGPGYADMARASEVEIREIEWLWPGRIALGKFNMVIGDPELAKSTLCTDLAARTTRGEDWPDGEPGGEPGGVVILSAEDSEDDTIVPRLMAAGADLGRVTILRGTRRPEGRGYFSLKRDLPALAEAISATANCKMVIVDPISAYLDGVDSHTNADVRGLLGPLAELADAQRVAVVAITHLNKGGGSKSKYRAQGSIAFTATARAVWACVEEGEDSDRRVFGRVKSNLSPLTVPNLLYRVTGVHVAGIRQEVPRIEWLGPTEDRVDALMAAQCERSRPPTERDDAAAWLREVLADGPVLAAEVFAQGADAGFTTATLRRAKAALHIIARKQSQFQGKWEWALPQSRTTARAAEPITYGPESAEDAFSQHLNGHTTLPV